MSIAFDPAAGTLTLSTRNTVYQMGLGPLGHLLHLYYGRRAAGCFDYLYIPRDCGFSPNPYDLREGRGWSLDTQPQEYSGSNTGDFRLSSLELAADDGVRGADLRYVRHEIRPGKYELPGLPSAHDPAGEGETLSVTLRDEAAGVEAELLYGVFPSADVITRAVRVHNAGDRGLWLEKAASACLDIPFGDWDVMHFHGRHTMERQPERAPAVHGIQTVSSDRGASGHQHNPFVILCDREAGEENGECYGVMPVYSGDHRTDIELDQTGSLRVVSGIGWPRFRWRLEPGDSFYCPEVILAFTGDGLGGLSRIFHRFLRRNICRGAYADRARPVLLNSWEASYFDFDEDSILALARGAKELGAELLVLDDGWFSGRSDDTRALGDWTPDRNKLPGGLRRLARGVNELGLKFGLWVEPEMVSEDSDLYRAHPDWALTVPGRKPAMSRDQLVLDLSRREVADHITEVLSDLLRSCPIEYIKWDMNRSLSDVFSRALPPERQGEVSHRYVLGLYSVLSRLTEAFPNVLFEGCAGGGGRFDAGMLAYCPQIWCSDNTDPIARLAIQHGTSYGYPLSAMGAHISASPNHQTGRRTPLGTRAAAAMTACFGLELDPAALSDGERAEVRVLVEEYKTLEELIRTGDCYRLAGPGGGYTAWECAAADGSEALVTLVITEPEGNPRPMRLRLRGLDPAENYVLERRDFFGTGNDPKPTERRLFSGGALMYGGYPLPPMQGDYPGARLLFRRA